MISKSSKKIFAKKSLNVTNVKLLSIFFSTFLAFLCLFGENDIKNLNGLNDLNSLNNLSGLNDLYSLISSKKY